MRPRVFLDTNILLSGIFFSGNEARVLDIVEIELLSCQDAVEELTAVVRKKLNTSKTGPMK